MKKIIDKICQKYHKNIESDELIDIEKIKKDVEKIKKDLTLLKFAIADPKGMGKLALMMHNAYIPQKYEHIFYKMKEGDFCVDCGANIGLIIDIIRHQRGTVYAFEPSYLLSAFLKRKYHDDKNVHIYQQAVSDKNGKAIFNVPIGGDDKYLISSLCGNITQIDNLGENVPGGFCKSETVKTIDLVQFIKEEILSKKPNLYLLKIDIEGSEFEVLNAIIHSHVHENIKYIVCETHERFFSDGAKRLEKVSRLINDNQIENIYLDWA